MVLAASGVEHEDLLSYAEPLLSDLPKVAPPETPKSVYVGGDYRCQADSPVCIILFMMHFFFSFHSVNYGAVYNIHSFSESRRLMLRLLLNFLAVGTKRRMP